MCDVVLLVGCLLWCISFSVNVYIRVEIISTENSFDELVLFGSSKQIDTFCEVCAILGCCENNDF